MKNKDVSVKLWEQVAKDIKEDIKTIYKTSNERLLKEEQVRSSVYYTLKRNGYNVAVERNYSKNESTECDVVFGEKELFNNWVEIKTSHYSKATKDDNRRTDRNGKDTWNNKPAEQLKLWKKDFEKLKKLNDSKKYFVLVGQSHNENDTALEYHKNKLNNLNEIFSCTFELNWKNAPLDFCTVSIFEINH